MSKALSNTQVTEESDSKGSWDRRLEFDIGFPRSDDCYGLGQMFPEARKTEASLNLPVYSQSATGRLFSCYTALL